MKCKHCKSVIDKNSVFCKYCGNKVHKDSSEIAVPKPWQKADGTYIAQVMKDGVRMRIQGSTLAEYKQNARNYIRGEGEFAEVKPKEPTFEVYLDKYIEDNSNILSPTTLRSYDSMRRNRFDSILEKEIGNIDWQEFINELAEKYKAPKTVLNTWALVTPVLNRFGFPVPDVNLPQIPPSDEPFLDYEQIEKFMNEIKGTEIELGALLGLHGLRYSELAALTVDDIKDGQIIINKAYVRARDKGWVIKNTNKNKKSTRTINIFIPRILEILPKEGRLVTKSYNRLCYAVNKVCIKLGFEPVGMHGLRRSCASLCYHLKIDERTVMAIGGWSSMDIPHRVYIKLAQKDKDENFSKLENYFKFTRYTKLEDNREDITKKLAKFI